MQRRPNKQLEQMWTRAAIHEDTMRRFRQEARKTDPNFPAIADAVLEKHGRTLTTKQVKAIRSQVRNLALAAQVGRKIQEACRPGGGTTAADIYSALSGQHVRKVRILPSVFGIRFLLPPSEIRRLRPNALATSRIEYDEKADETPEVKKVREKVEKEFGASCHYLRQIALLCPRRNFFDKFMEMNDADIHEHEQNHLISRILDAHLPRGKPKTKGQTDASNVQNAGRSQRFRPIEEIQADWKNRPWAPTFWKKMDWKDHLMYGDDDYYWLCLTRQGMHAQNYISSVESAIEHARKGKHPLPRLGQDEHFREIAGFLQTQGIALSPPGATEPEKVHWAFYGRMRNGLRQTVKREKMAVLDRLAELARLQRRHGLSNDFIRGLFLTAEEPTTAIDAIRHNTTQLQTSGRN